MTTEEILKRAIPKYSVAYNLVEMACRAHYKQWRLIEALQEHIEGRRPVDPEKLKKQGLSWCANYNFGKARSQIEKGVVDLVKKVTEALWIGIPDFRAYDPMEDRANPKTQFLQDHNDRERVASMMGCSFAQALEEDGDFYNWINTAEYLSYTFGYCPLDWSGDTWVCDPIKLTKIAFRPGSTAQEVDTWVIFRSESARDLFNTWKRLRKTNASNFEQGLPPKDGHWKYETLDKVLQKLTHRRKHENGQHETWAEVIHRFDECQGEVIAETEDLNIAVIYQKEMDGSISEIYIPWGYDWSGLEPQKQGNLAEGVADFLYYRNWPNKKWKDFLAIIRDSGFTENGDIHSMRGIGRQAVENSIRYNRMRNGLVDKAQLVGSPMFEQPTTQSGQKFKLTLSHGFTLLQPGYVPIERQPSFDINSHLAIINHEDAEFNELNSHYKQEASGRLSSRPTEAEVQMAQTEVLRTKSAKDRIKLSDYSHVFYMMMRKMGSSALRPTDTGYEAQQKFYKLLKRYLPDLCQSDEDCKELISLVDGYTIDLVNMDMAALQMALQLAETPFARNRIRRMMLIMQGFSIRDANVIVPVTSDKFTRFDDERVARIENTMFRTTDKVTFQETDDDIVHFQIHGEAVAMEFEAIRYKRTTATAAYDFLIRIYAHMMMHVESLLNDPVLKGTAEQMLKEMESLKRTLGQVAYARNKEIQAQAEAAQYQNPGISPKDAHDIRLKDAQAMAQEQRNIFKTEQRGRLKEQELQNQHEQKMEEIRLEHERETRAIDLAEQRERAQPNGAPA